MATRFARPAIGTIALAVCLLALLDSLVPTSRSVLLNVETTSLELTLSTGAEFRLDGLKSHCIRGLSPLQHDPVCGAGMVPVSSNAGVMRIDEGDTIRLRVNPDGSVRIAIQKAGQPSASEVAILPPTKEREVGMPSLAAQGALKLGVQIGQGGSSELLRSGRYEFRDRTLLSHLTAEPAIITARGDLLPGSVVTIGQRRHDEADMAVVISMSGTDGARPALSVSAVSKPGDIFLRQSFPFADPVDLAPSWTQRLLASPLLLVIVFVLQGIIAALELAGTIFGRQGHRF